MAVSNSARRAAASIAGVLLIALGGAASAANPPTVAAPSSPTRAMRQEMAALHEQMAACLRSDKSISECRTEMLKHCQDMMGSRGCTRMMHSGGMMGMGSGMMGTGQGMRGRMTSKPPSTSSPPQ
jgi:hypothetical protein